MTTLITIAEFAGALVVGLVLFVAGTLFRQLLRGTGLSGSRARTCRKNSAGFGMDKIA